MDPRIIRRASEGPQVSYLTQNTSRGNPPSDFPRIRDHVPWTVRWEEYQASEVARDGNIRFDFPSEGDLLHAAFLVLRLRGIQIPLPVGPNLIRDITLKCDGEVVDRIEGEWIAISHDMDRDGDRHIGRDILEYNIPGTVLDISDEDNAEKDIIIDLPLIFRDQASISRGLPLFLLNSSRHEIKVRTRYPCRLAGDTVCSDSGLPERDAPKEDTWIGRISDTGGIVSASIMYEVSDLPTRDRYGIRGFEGSLISSRVPRPEWSLPIITRTFNEIPLQGRHNHSIILPYQNELVGIIFAFRPVFHQRAGRNTRFDMSSGTAVSDVDLDETLVDPLYEMTDCSSSEILKSADFVIGSHVLERREAIWWRQESWIQSGRIPPDRTRFVYGRFWDIDSRVPSGGTFLEHMPRTELRIHLRETAPDCNLLLWGLRRTTGFIQDQILRLKDLHA